MLTIFWLHDLATVSVELKLNRNAESSYRKTNALDCQYPSYIFADKVGTSWYFAMELAIGRVRARR